MCHSAHIIDSTDTIIMNVDFDEDIVSFKSMPRKAQDYNKWSNKTGKPTKIIRDLKDGIDTVRFCAELTWQDSVIEFGE